MKINVGINEFEEKVLFVTDDDDYKICELKISDEYYIATLKEFGIIE